MAKSAAPLILGLGAAALLFGGSKKKKSGKKLDVDTHYDVADYLDPEAPNADGYKLILDEECSAIAHKIDEAFQTAHNSYITSRFDQMVAEGETNPDTISLQLLSEQSEHCPWGESPDQWTPLMKGLYDQLRAAVATYYQLKVEHGQIQP